jgi:hypothetical protein
MYRFGSRQELLNGKKLSGWLIEDSEVLLKNPLVHKIMHAGKRGFLHSFTSKAGKLQYDLEKVDESLNPTKRNKIINKTSFEPQDKK